MFQWRYDHGGFVVCVWVFSIGQLMITGHPATIRYVPPSDVVIAPDVEIPQITERQVWNILAKLKRTATGPDEIPYCF